MNRRRRIATPDPITVFAGLDNNVSRHATFIHFILGLDWFDAALMAESMRDEPITEEHMRFIAKHWDDPATAPDLPLPEWERTP